MEVSLDSMRARGSSGSTPVGIVEIIAERKMTAPSAMLASGVDLHLDAIQLSLVVMGSIHEDRPMIAGQDTLSPA